MLIPKGSVGSIPTVRTKPVPVLDTCLSMKSCQYRLLIAGRQNGRYHAICRRGPPMSLNGSVYVALNSVMNVSLIREVRARTLEIARQFRASFTALLVLVTENAGLRHMLLTA